MCHKKSPSNVHNKTNNVVSSNTLHLKTSKSTVSLKPPHRKTRTKLRKLKYLSIRLQLSPHTSLSKNSESNSDRAAVDKSMLIDQEPSLYPLYSENDRHEHDGVGHDRDEHDDVAFLFNHSEDNATTLTGLLGSDSTTQTTGIPTTAMSSEEDSFSPPASVLSYARFDCVDNAQSLVRKAMRRKGRDAKGERWVCYSEVVEKQEQTTEETNSAHSVASATVKKEKEEPYNYSYYGCNHCGSFENKNPTKGSGKTTTLGSLSLKLDYQEILNAWSDKGPWYLDGESPQTVPELHDEILCISPASNFAMDVWGSCSAGAAANVWRVPEIGGVDGKDCVSGKEGHKSWKTDQGRAESVLRYKEKRQSRLFSKRIRYEVRKINAEKRPRMKGRFVKR